jgi:hypothetical protein
MLPLSPHAEFHDAYDQQVSVSLESSACEEAIRGLDSSSALYLKGVFTVDRAAVLGEHRQE